MYAAFLRFQGLRVLEAASGERAVELALACAPDVILMDMAMPGIDGCEATRRVVTSAVGAPVAVVAFSADDSRVNIRRARDAGCSDFVPKPCSAERLLTTILAAHQVCKQGARPREQPCNR